MPGPERFSPVVPLPPLGAWRRVLALDRGAGVPHPVALSFPPAPVVDDPARLAQVVRDVEAAGRLHHPGAVAVLGLETVGEAPAIVEEWVRGVTLRDLLDAAGRLPPDVAARVVLDACAAVARAHALDAGDGRPLVHGAIGPAAIVLAEDGAVRLGGFGACGGASPGDDVLALGAVLHECLAGEAPAVPPRPLDVPGIPAPLAAAVDAATGAGAGPRPAAPAALAQAVAGAGPVASHGDVAAYADAILPPGEGTRGERERALSAALSTYAPEVSAELIFDPVAAGHATGTAGGAAPVAPVRPVAPVAPARPGGAPVAEPTPEPLPRPPSTRPGADPAGVFAAPRPVARRSRAPLAVVTVCLAVGFAAGFAGSRLRLRALGPAASDPSPVAEANAPLPGPPAAAALESAPAQPAPAQPRPADRREAKAKAERRKPAPAAAKAASRSRPAPAAPEPSGFLDVKAPAEADVFLDGYRVGKGGLRREIPAGAHRIEVRLGEASASERFEVAPGETWTYEVTPTP